MTICRLTLVLAGILAVGCASSATPSTSATAHDAVTADASDSAGEIAQTAGDAAQDSGSADLDAQTGSDGIAAVDADGAAAGPKTTPWGAITGACGTLAPEMASSKPSFHVAQYDFASPVFKPAALRPLATKRYFGPNAGGSSKCSEAMSMQMLADCEGILGLKTELEIAFTSPGQTTDWLGQFGSDKVGVSVSRAYQGPNDNEYTVADADKLLRKKLGGINASTQLVAPADKWKKQILHIWTLQPTWVPTLKQAWDALEAELRTDTIILVTVEVSSTAITADSCGAP